MRIRTAITVCFATVGVALGAGVTSASAAGCASTCAVGGAGTGGTSSDGAAQGFRLEGSSSRFPDTTFTNQGNENAGHISLTGTGTGMASGAFTPRGTVVGHYTGDVAISFGTTDPCSGVCG